MVATMAAASATFSGLLLSINHFAKLPITMFMCE
jgi:hypothetical protein